MMLTLLETIWMKLSCKKTKLVNKTTICSGNHLVKKNGSYVAKSCFASAIFCFLSRSIWFCCSLLTLPLPIQSNVFPVFVSVKTHNPPPPTQNNWMVFPHECLYLLSRVWLHINISYHSAIFFCCSFSFFSHSHSTLFQKYNNVFSKWKDVWVKEYTAIWIHRHTYRLLHVVTHHTVYTHIQHTYTHQEGVLSAVPERQ